MTIDNESRVLQNSGDTLFHQTHFGMKPNSEDIEKQIREMSSTSLKPEHTDILDQKEKQTAFSMLINQPS